MYHTCIILSKYFDGFLDFSTQCVGLLEYICLYPTSWLTDSSLGFSSTFSSQYLVPNIKIRTLLLITGVTDHCWKFISVKTIYSTVRLSD